MFTRLLTRESPFFNLFSGISDLIVLAAREFKEMMEDLALAEMRAARIKDLEHQADEITHRTIDLLHKTFITPLDREDIHRLISKLDDVLDFIEAAAQRIVLYGVQRVTPETLELADVCVKATESMQQAVHGLRNLKNSARILEHCVEINRLENQADALLRTAMAKLFQDEPDTRELIKMKEIYELLETVTDRCEDVANLVDGIILEYA